MLIPKHIAIIMDGNGRWAKKRGLPRLYGHHAGMKSVREVVRAASDTGIRVLTLYAFSTENWNRPKSEIKGLFNLLKLFIKKELGSLHKNNVKVIIIGRISELPINIVKLVKKATEKTSKNTGMILNIALNYGGRQEIVDAVNEIITEGIYKKVDEKIFEKYLYTTDLPFPDLIIRTSGESRISNFLLWQSAYSEFYTTKTLWPDFKKKNLMEAISDYQKRNRRFGGL
ncbi:MAG: isoprenyl transferase [Elusimicrobia bacterium CG06_land_8_20_14_3_00_38_11]|nr:MAG: isoprenyl transferase [Elusimicrobia bacterium CG06_land_8_20_14_3_00_38_11]